MSAKHLPCPHDGCPGLEMHEGKPDGCGHGTIDKGCMSLIAERDGLRLAFAALANFVLAEFPAGMSLGEIAETWPPDFGDPITPEQIEALRALEGAR